MNGMEWNGMEWNGMEWNGMEAKRIMSVIYSIQCRFQLLNSRILAHPRTMNV
jgi:hypothetical protein